MAFSNGYSTITVEDIRKYIGEDRVASYYLGINKIPCLIKSPLRMDKNPSFGIYYTKDGGVSYTDFAKREGGSIYTLLGKIWNIPFKQVLDRISRELPGAKTEHCINPELTYRRRNHSPSESDLRCKVRPWMKYDIDYWNSYGISLKWLKYANVYPISHKIVVKDDQTYIFGADKYAYAYVEFKEGKTTLKIYQPFNTKGYKWSNKHDRSVISLWTKVPLIGDRIVICSSLKDALCLWANTGIPAIAVQGEGYGMSDTAISELKKRFKEIFILFDNDIAGINDGIKLSSQTGFKNLILPQFDNGKDVSDLYKVKEKDEFRKIILSLFKEDTLPY